MDVLARYFELFDNLISKMPVTDDVNVWIGYLGIGVNLLFLIYYPICTRYGWNQLGKQ